MDRIRHEIVTPVTELYERTYIEKYRYLLLVCFNFAFLFFKENVLLPPLLNSTFLRCDYYRNVPNTNPNNINIYKQATTMRPRTPPPLPSRSRSRLVKTGKNYHFSTDFFFNISNKFHGV